MKFICFFVVSMIITMFLLKQILYSRSKITVLSTNEQSHVRGMLKRDGCVTYAQS